MERKRKKITNRSTLGSDPCNPSYIDIPPALQQLLINCWNVYFLPYAFLKFFLSFFAPLSWVCVFAPESQPPPRLRPPLAFAAFSFLCFHISLSAPTTPPPPASSSSQHKLVLLSLPLIPSSVPTIPSSFLLHSPLPLFAPSAGFKGSSYLCTPFPTSFCFLPSCLFVCSIFVHLVCKTTCCFPCGIGVLCYPLIRGLPHHGEFFSTSLELDFLKPWNWGHQICCICHMCNLLPFRLFLYAKLRQATLCQRYICDLQSIGRTAGLCKQQLSQCFTSWRWLLEKKVVIVKGDQLKVWRILCSCGILFREKLVTVERHWVKSTKGKNHG